MLMSRIARIILEGVPYHVTQRGNGRQQVFFEDRDYGLYLDVLRDNCQKERLPVWDYCLMPNRIHLIAVPEARPPWRKRRAGPTPILPVRAHLAARAEEYAWSSAGLRLRGAAGLVDLTPAPCVLRVTSKPEKLSASQSTTYPLFFIHSARPPLTISPEANHFGPKRKPAA